MLRILAALAFAAVATASQTAAAATPWDPDPPVHASGASPQAGPLDLASASLGQRATRLELVVETRGPWQPAQLSHRGPRSLCLVLAYGELAKLCVAGVNGRPILRRTPVDAAGNATGPSTRVSADLSLENGRRLSAAFTPLAAGLPLARFDWALETQWTPGPACLAGASCADRLPLQGALEGRATLLAQPSCFGAAAMDRSRPCSNPALRRVVTPTPSEALLTPNAPCSLTEAAALVSPCFFGAAAADARASVALIGDSHAEHWRGAIEVVAQGMRWRGVSIILSSCPLTAVRVTWGTPAQSKQCRQWAGDVRRWLASNPDVSTVVVSAHSGTWFDGDAVAGYRAAWRGLPRSVRRIFVLRDTPRVVRPQAACVERLMRRREPIGSRCAQSRSRNVPPDPQAIAAARGADPRVKLIDLTRLMCTATVCPPVIGGVLVRKDGNHLTRTFAATMGPFVLNAIRGATVAEYDPWPTTRR